MEYYTIGLDWPATLSGNQEHPALIFLHGFLGDRQDWSFALQMLQSRYYCIAPDLPGHGDNHQVLPEQELTFEWLATGLKQFLDQLGVAQAHLVGYSMGGRLALYFSIRYPTLVRSLILESASPGIEESTERQARYQQDAQRATQIITHGLDAFIEKWYQMPLFAGLWDNPELLETIKARRKQNDPIAVARCIQELSPGIQPSLWHKMGEILAPVLLLAGAKDLKYQLLVEKMVTKMPRAQLEIAPGAGHTIHLEKPQWFIQQLHNFLVTLT